MHLRRVSQEVIAVILVTSTFICCFEIEQDEASWLNDVNVGDQWTMESMIRETEGIDIFRTIDGSFNPVCSWPGVSCANHGKISSIEWTDMAVGVVGGEIFLQWLPSMLEKVHIQNRHVWGQIETVLLPPETKEVILSGNHFYGTIDCTKFPSSLQIFDIHNNFVEGTINLTRLPHHLRILRFDSNRIEQDVCFVSIPPAVELIDIRSNRIGTTVNHKGIELCDSRLAL